MIIQLSETLYSEFFGKLERAVFGKEPGNGRLQVCVRLSKEYLGKLRELVDRMGFAGTEQEILFFKEIKPKFCQWMIYEQGLFQLLASKPKGSPNTVSAYFEGELKQLLRFFNRNRFQYEYFRNEMSEMDHLFFLRGAEVHIPSTEELAQIDTAFSTAMDFLFAKFSAYEMLQDFIVEQICPQQRPSSPASKIDNAIITPGLRWTGESINVVELAYGIWLTGQINHGNASVSEIIRWLENSLQTNIGRPYRRWTEISRRDRTTTTKYLDRMREAIHSRRDNEDDLARQRRCERRGQ